MVFDWSTLGQRRVEEQEWLVEEDARPGVALVGKTWSEAKMTALNSTLERTGGCPIFRGGRKGKKSNHDCDDKKNKGGLVHRIQILRNENNSVLVNSPLKLQNSLCTEEWAASKWTSSILANPRVDRVLPGPTPRLESPSLRGRCWRGCPWGRKLSAETRCTSSEASSPAGTLALFHAIT